jgi:hypothetical protein
VRPDDLELDAGAGAVHVHQHLARPLAATKRTAREVLGVDGDKLALACKRLGVQTTPLPGGDFAVLVDDFERALRSRGNEEAKPVDVDVDVDEDLEDACARAARPRKVGR